MRNNDDDSEIRTVFCGNLSELVTDSILFELFNQVCYILFLVYGFMIYS